MREVLLRFQHFFFADDYGPLKSKTLMAKKPKSFPPFHVSPVERDRIKVEEAKMKKKNVVKESVSPW
jgi:hypothetical protein